MKARVKLQHCRLEAKTTEIEARMASCLYGPSTAGCSQWCKSVMDSGWGTSGKGMHKQQPCINAGDSVHDLSVKLSPCMCSHSSFLGWGNDWHNIMWYLAISGEDLYNFVYYRQILLCHENSKSAVCCLLRLTPQWSIITSKKAYLAFVYAYQE